MEKENVKLNRLIKLYQILFFVSIILQPISLILLILGLALFFSYWCIASTMLFIVLTVSTYVIFAQFTNLYPLNELKQYAFTPKKTNLINMGNGKYELHLENDGNGKWIITNSKDPFVLDLRGYLFPKAYILSFFVRQFSYPVINQKRLRLKCLGESIKVEEKFKSVNIVIRDKREKTYPIVKNGRTVLKIYRGIINLTPFYVDGIISRDSRLRHYVEINEKICFYEKKRK